MPCMHTSGTLLGTNKQYILTSKVYRVLSLSYVGQKTITASPPLGKRCVYFGVSTYFHVIVRRTRQGRGKGKIKKKGKIPMLWISPFLGVYGVQTSGVSYLSRVCKSGLTQQRKPPTCEDGSDIWSKARGYIYPPLTHMQQREKKKKEEHAGMYRRERLEAAYTLQIYEVVKINQDRKKTEEKY